MGKIWTTKDDRRVNEYAEILFDEIHEESPNAALWFHCTPEGDAAIYLTRDEPERRELLIQALVEAMDDDSELLKDFATAVALAVQRLNDERGFVDWDDLFDT